MTQPEQDRLREHPHERFATDQAVFDLAAAAAALRAEPNAGQHGHRQQVLWRDGGTTVALYSFEPGSSLQPHTTGGVVIIQCVKGKLEVRTDEQVYRVPADSLVALSPGVRHAVHAVEPSLMLLTVELRARE